MRDEKKRGSGAFDLDPLPTRVCTYMWTFAKRNNNQVATRICSKNNAHDNYTGFQLLYFWPNNYLAADFMSIFASRVITYLPIRNFRKDPKPHVSCSLSDFERGLFARSSDMYEYIYFSDGSIKLELLTKNQCAKFGAICFCFNTSSLNLSEFSIKFNFCPPEMTTPPAI